MSVRWHRLSWLVAVVGVVAGCTSGGQSPPTSAPSSSTSGESTPESVTPSITREVPPAQRQRLVDLPADRLCGLVSPEDLARLAFPVEPGRPREIGFDPPARGCTFNARSGVRSILIGIQPQGYGLLGAKQVDLGGVRGTKIRHANDCTVLADVTGATLQVSVVAGEADSEQCESAQGVAQYVAAGVER